MLEDFQSNEVSGMEKYPNRLVVLLIDFDGKEGRLNYAKTSIPEHLRDRVFVPGAWKEPQDLRTSGLGSFEEIGMSLAQDCQDGTNRVWGHDLMKNNAGELARLCERIRPILSS